MAVATRGKKTEPCLRTSMHVCLIQCTCTPSVGTGNTIITPSPFNFKGKQTKLQRQLLISSVIVECVLNWAVGLPTIIKTFVYLSDALLGQSKFNMCC